MLSCSKDPTTVLYSTKDQVSHEMRDAVLARAQVPVVALLLASAETTCAGKMRREIVREISVELVAERMDICLATRLTIFDKAPSPGDRIDLLQQRKKDAFINSKTW